MTLALFFALIGGFIPSLLWLWFWLKEDSLHPEPRKMIIKSFLAGAGVVPIAFIFQQLVAFPLIGSESVETIIKTTPYLGILIIIAWATIEEVLKFTASYVTGIRSKDDDEPIDAVMYLITAALGFAAAENALFLFSPLLDGDVFKTIITGNLRFMGATLLHIASSGIIGLFFAFSFYKHGRAKKRIVGLGIILATLLHVIFNLFIMTNAGNTFLAFALVWSVVVIIILMLEKVKHIAHKN